MEVLIAQKQREEDFIIPIVRFGRKKYPTGYSISWTGCECSVIELLEELDERMYDVVD